MTASAPDPVSASDGPDRETRPVLKLSAPATRDYWEIPVVYEDEHLLAIEKPSGLLTCPDRYDPKRPNLMRLLHEHIARGVPWARERGLTYLSNAHRLDFETSGILLLARSKPVLVTLANQFGSLKPAKTYFALAHGGPQEDRFTVDVKLAAHPTRIGWMHVNQKTGKRSRTDFKVIKRYIGFTALECYPLTGRTHQIRVHLKWVRCPIVGDSMYGGAPLRLSEIKSGYRKPRGREERPLMGRVALHAGGLDLDHPVTGAPIHLESPLPRDLRVALKYLDRFATASLSETPQDVG